MDNILRKFQKSFFLLQYSIKRNKINNKIKKHKKNKTKKYNCH